MKNQSPFAAISRTLYLFAAFLFISFASRTQSLQFYQLSFDHDGTINNNSDWGAVDITYTGNLKVLYFNLTIQNTTAEWVIENMPVLSIKGPGVQQTNRFWFDIGDAGTPVSGIGYGFSLTLDTIPAAPAVNNSSSVNPEKIILYSGLIGAPGVGGPVPADKQKGGKVINDSIKPTHKDFISQECDTNECVPASISNSLKWLNARESMNIDPALISISEIGKVLGYVKKYGVQYNKSFIGDKKKQYCKEKKIFVNTITRGGQNIKTIEQEIKDGQDVEVIFLWSGGQGKGHAIAITGIKEITDKNGKGTDRYAIAYAEDSKQGVAGGTSINGQAVYDKKKNKWEGSLSNASGTANDFFFIVECPDKEKIQSSKKAPSGNNYSFTPNRPVFYEGGKYELKNLSLSGYNNNVTPSALGSSTTFTFSGTCSLELSSDSGLTYTGYAAPFSSEMRLSHVLDSAGREYYYSEITVLDISGGSLPAGIHFRESPAPLDTSVGMMSIRTVSASDFRIMHSVNIWLEMSVDNGSSWKMNDEGTEVLYMEGSIVTDVPFLIKKCGNPATLYFHADTDNIFQEICPGENCSIEVYTIAGQKIYSNLLFDSFFSAISLPAGMYIYKSQSSDRVIRSGKFVVIKE